MKDSHIHSGLIDHTHDDIFSIAQKSKEIGSDSHSIKDLENSIDKRKNLVS